MIPENKRQDFITVVEDLIRELDAGIKFYEIYPITHPQIIQITEKIFFLLIKVLRDYSDYFQFINLTNTSGALYCDAVPIPETHKSQLFKKFRDTLNQKNVMNLTFIDGFDKDELVRFLSLMALPPDERLTRGDYIKLAHEMDIFYIKTNHLNLGGGAETDDIHLLRFFNKKIVGSDRQSYIPILLNQIRIQPQKVMRILVTVAVIEGDYEVYEDSGSRSTRLAKKVTLELGALFNELHSLGILRDNFFHIGQFIRQAEPWFLAALGSMPVLPQAAAIPLLDEEGKVTVPDADLIQGIIDRNQYLKEYYQSQTLITDIILDIRNELRLPLDERNSDKFATAFTQFLQQLEFSQDRYKVMKPDIDAIVNDLFENGDTDRILALLNSLLHFLEAKADLEETADALVASISTAVDKLLSEPKKSNILDFARLVIDCISKAKIPHRYFVKFRDRIIHSFRSIMTGMPLGELGELQTTWLDELQNNLSQPRVVYLTTEVLIEIGRSLNNLAKWELVHDLGEKLKQIGSDESLPLTVRDSLVNAHSSFARAKIFDELFMQMIGDKRSERMEAINTLVKAGPQVLPLAIERVKGNEWYTRRNTLVVIERVGSTAELEVILPLARDPQWQVRKEAIKTIGLLCDRFWRTNSNTIPPSIANTLIAKIRDEDMRVQIEAIKQIGALRLPKGASYLIQYCDSLIQDFSGKELALAQEIYNSLLKLALNSADDDKEISVFLAQVATRKEKLLSKIKFKDIKLMAVKTLANMKTPHAIKELEKITDKLKGECKNLAESTIEGCLLEEDQPEPPQQ